MWIGREWIIDELNVRYQNCDWSRVINPAHSYIESDMVVISLLSVRILRVTNILYVVLSIHDVLTLKIKIFVKLCDQVSKIQGV